MIQRSTLRLTLAALLRERLGLELAGPEALTPEGERALSDWMRRHLSVAVFPYEDREGLREIEAEVIGRIDAPLNLAKVSREERLKLTKARRIIRRGVRG